MKIKNLEIKILTTVIIIGLLIPTIIAAYWTIFPTKVVEFNQDPMPVVNPDKEVYAGGELQYVADVCKYVDKEATATTSFVDGVIWSTGTQVTKKFVGCTSQIQIAQVPKNLPTGEYKYRILLVYKLNPIRTETFVIETEPFLVIK